jgi:hypothetical protein
VSILLHIGRQLTGFTVRPDAVWPGMWRVHAADGRVSDMINSHRAKDAALAWARPRGLGGNETVHWDREMDAAGSSMRFTDRPATPPRASAIPPELAGMPP